MKYEHVSDKYATQLADVARTLVTPERFGAVVLAAQEVETPDYIARIYTVDGLSEEATLIRDVYSVIGEDYVNERSPYEEPRY
jgi:hypothetical protein